MRRRVTPTPCVAWLLPTLSAAAVLACNPPKLDQDGDGFTELTGDCDDLDANVHPEAQEVCYNGIDDNCNGVEDEEGATSGRIWYQDYDGDGYGKEDLTVLACNQPEGYAAEKWDCQEDNAAIHPGAVEVCDSVDNDCDGQVDETTADDAKTWYPDGDGDGYGDADRAVTACESPGEGWIADGTDCADTDPLVSPEQTESCLTPYDDNCDGSYNREDAFGCTDYYADMDGDGFAGTAACLCAPEAPYTETDSSDCDDSTAAVYPGAPTGDVGWSDGNCDGSVARRLVDADARFEPGRYDYTTALNRALAWEGGDMDGDGMDDLVITVNDSYDGYTVVVASGATLMEQHVLQESATAGVVRLDEGDGGASVQRDFGVVPSRVADINDDGLADLLLMQEVIATDDSVAYEVRAFLGPVSGALDASTPDAFLSLARQSTGNSDSRDLEHSGHVADGRVTLALSDPGFGSGAVGRIGQVTLIGWDTETNDLAAVHTYQGVNDSQELGDIVGVAGDVNGDGLDDRIFATTGSVTSDPYGLERSHLGGVIEVFTDETLYPHVTFVSNAGLYRIVDKLGGAGDLNGDGHADLVFSASDSHIGARSAGRVEVVWGPIDTGVQELAMADRLTIRGDQDSQNVDCPAVLPDATGDGRDDLAIGAYFTYDTGLTGLTYVWAGADLSGTLIAGQEMVAVADEGVGSRQVHGYCSGVWQGAGSVGDANGDGLGDLLIRGALAEEDDPEKLDTLFLFLGVQP